MSLRTFVSGEKTGGLIVVSAALIGLILANSPARDAFQALAGARVGPTALHLNLTVGQWAADGLLAIFFFVVGLELKNEFTSGTLRSPAKAAIPIAAAVGGMAVPALIYVAVTAWLQPEALSGWAIPAATDIAFALAVLAIFGSTLPTAIRTFLLTLAVVDDLLAIIVIAVFYGSGFSLLFLVGSLAAAGFFALAARASSPRWWVLIPLALLAWAFMHESGVHATIAGVILGLLVPAARVHAMEHAVRPISSGIALPLFALFASGVTVVGGGGLREVLLQPVTFAVTVALVVGKLVGVLGVSLLLTRTTRLRLPDAVGIRDLIPVALLAGIGFTVSLLIAELSFEVPTLTASAKLGVLLGTFVAALLAALALVRASKAPRSVDMNEDGVPDRDTAPLETEDPSWTPDH